MFFVRFFVYFVYYYLDALTIFAQCLNTSFISTCIASVISAVVLFIIIVIIYYCYLKRNVPVFEVIRTATTLVFAKQSLWAKTVSLRILHLLHICLLYYFVISFLHFINSIFFVFFGDRGFRTRKCNSLWL